MSYTISIFTPNKCARFLFFICSTPFCWSDRMEFFTRFTLGLPIKYLKQNDKSKCVSKLVEVQYPVFIRIRIIQLDIRSGSREKKEMIHFSSLDPRLELLSSSSARPRHRALTSAVGWFCDGQRWRGRPGAASKDGRPTPACTTSPRQAS